jgi:hypothetical protein
MLDATVRIAVTLTVPLATAAALSPVISLIAFGSLGVWTVLYVRARRAAAAAAATAA